MIDARHISTMPVVTGHSTRHTTMRAPVATSTVTCQGMNVRFPDSSGASFASLQMLRSSAVARSGPDGRPRGFVII